MERSLFGAGLLIFGLRMFGQAGSLDVSFDPGIGPNDNTTALLVQADGRILVGGQFTLWNGAPCPYLTRLDSDGSQDPTFQPGLGPDLAVYCSALQPDGRMIIGGEFSAYDGTTRYRLARILANGALDTSFVSHFGPGDGNVLALLVLADGKILVGGDFQLYDGTAYPGLVRLLPNGLLDGSFDPDGGPVGRVDEVKEQPDGKLIACGDFDTQGGLPYENLLRLNTDGSVDELFDPGTGPSGPVFTAELRADGRLFLAGGFTSFNDATHPRAVQLGADGALDTTFDGPSIGNSVISSILQPDGKVVLGGVFNLNDNDVSYPGIARLLSDGSVDPTFQPGMGADLTITETESQADGKILIGGSFTTYDGVTRMRIARLHNDLSTHVPSDISHATAVFPNPSTGLFVVRGSGSGLIQLQVTDVTGAIIQITQLGSTGEWRSVVDLGGEPSGVYVLHATSQGERHTARLVKE